MLRTIECKLSARSVFRETGAGKLMRCSQERQGDRQIEAGPLLLQLRRRQVDRDATAGELELCGENATANSLLRLLTRAIGEPDDRQRRRLAALNMRLHLHPPRLEADEGKGNRAREHTSTLRHDLQGVCAGSAPNS